MDALRCTVDRADACSAPVDPALWQEVWRLLDSLGYGDGGDFEGDEGNDAPDLRRRPAVPWESEEDAYLAGLSEDMQQLEMARRSVE